MREKLNFSLNNSNCSRRNRSRQHFHSLYQLRLLRFLHKRPLALNIHLHKPNNLMKYRHYKYHKICHTQSNHFLIIYNSTQNRKMISNIHLLKGLILVSKRCIRLNLTMDPRRNRLDNCLKNRASILIA